MLLPVLRVALLQDFLALPQSDRNDIKNTNTHTPIKPEPQIKKHTVEENLERIANSFENIEILLKRYLDLKR